MELNSGKSSAVGHNLELNPIIVSCLFHSNIHPHPGNKSPPQNTIKGNK